MTPRQIFDECKALANVVGYGSEISAHIFATSIGHSIRTEFPTVSLSLYTKGLARGRDLYVESEDWADAFAQLRALWLARADELTRQAVRTMALRIIAITADHGHCTDAALRAEFDPSEVERYGALAVEDANSIASTGPFSIIPAPKGNRRDGDTDDED